MSPEHFEEELKEKVFSFDTDRTVCAGLYRGVAEPLLANVERLEFKKLAWTAADWRHMGGALACCPKLRALYLEEMGADAAAMAAFGGALGSGAAPALEKLMSNKLGNEIGDEGARHLGDALARDAAPALKPALEPPQQQDRRRGGARHLLLGSRASRARGARREADPRLARRARELAAATRSLYLKVAPKIGDARQASGARAVRLAAQPDRRRAGRHAARRCRRRRAKRRRLKRSPRKNPANTRTYVTALNRRAVRPPESAPPSSPSSSPRAAAAGAAAGGAAAAGAAGVHR